MRWLVRLLRGGRSRPSAGLEQQPGRPVRHGVNVMGVGDPLCVCGKAGCGEVFRGEFGPELVNLPPGYRVSTPAECAAGWAPLTIRPVRRDRPPAHPPTSTGRAWWPR